MTQNAPLALVVEDNYIVLMDITRTLEDAGFRVLEAVGYQKAVQALEQHATSIRVMLTATQMEQSVKNGLDLAHMVAKTWPSIKIIIASGRASFSSGELPAGAAFLPKPFSDEDLLRCIADALAS